MKDYKDFLCKRVDGESDECNILIKKVIERYA